MKHTIVTQQSFWWCTWVLKVRRDGNLLPETKSRGKKINRIVKFCFVYPVARCLALNTFQVLHLIDPQSWLCSPDSWQFLWGLLCSVTQVFLMLILWQRWTLPGHAHVGERVLEWWESETLATPQVFHSRQISLGTVGSVCVNTQSSSCCCLVPKLYLTLCHSRDCSPPGSSVHGIIQARILELVAISFSRGSSWLRDWTHVSCIAGIFFTTEPPGKPQSSRILHKFHFLVSQFCNIPKKKKKVGLWISCSSQHWFNSHYFEREKRI